jgi:hypothetical protein
LSDLDGMEAGGVVDVVGVVESVAPWSTIQRKDGSEAKLRRVTIRDDSGRRLEVRSERSVRGVRRGEGGEESMAAVPYHLLLPLHI